MHRYTLTDEKLNDPIKDAVRKQRRNRALLQSEEALRQAHGQRPPTNVAGRPVVYRQRTFPDATPHYRAASTLGGSDACTAPLFGEQLHARQGRGSRVRRRMSSREEMLSFR